MAKYKPIAISCHYSMDTVSGCKALVIRVAWVQPHGTASSLIKPSSHSTTNSLRFRLLALLDNLVLVVGGGNAGGTVSIGIVGIGIGLTHSSSSRPAESDEIVREKSTVVALREIVLPLPIVGTALGVTGPTKSSSVPSLLWQLSNAEREESRLLQCLDMRRKRLPPLPPCLRVWTCPYHRTPKSASSGMSSSSPGSDIDSRLSSVSDHDGGSSTIESIILWFLNNYVPRLVYDFSWFNKAAYLCHPVLKIDPVLLCLA